VDGDAARRDILARRARFVAAALAGAGLACEARPPEAPVVTVVPARGEPPAVVATAEQEEALDAAAREDPATASAFDASEYAVRLADLEARVQELRNRPHPCLSIRRASDAGTADGGTNP
jgi:hypothetical protein